MMKIYLMLLVDTKQLNEKQFFEWKMNIDTYKM
jgi:hypothetical protein